MKFLASLVILLNISNINANEFSCFGTEPFWSASIKGNQVTLNMLGTDEVRATKIESVKNANGTGHNFAFVIETDKNMSLNIIQGQCSDGMSDNVYSHQILLNDNGNVFFGCCNLK